MSGAPGATPAAPRLRLAAALLDLLVLLGPAGLALVVALGLTARQGPGPLHGLLDRIAAAAPLLAGLLAAVAAAAAVGFWMRLSATPGMLLLGLRMVDARSARPLRAWQVLLRALGWVLAAIPLGLGLLWMLWDSRSQGLHDKLARCVVVTEDESLTRIEDLLEASQ